MNFADLIQELKKSGLKFDVANEQNAEINFLTADSRKVTENTIFACVKGEHADGHNFAAKAVEQGSAVLVCEHKLDISVPQIICGDVRRNMGIVAACLYGYPADKLKLIAITGTTGKTTSTFMTKAVLDYAGMKCGLLGSVYYDDGNSQQEAPRTTPEADIIQYKLAEMVKNGCKACVMEASSHSIVQGRLEGCKFDAAGFTNLTQDHLDYHLTMENYFEAKKELFKSYMRGNWKVSAFADNSYGAEICAWLKGKTISYSMENRDADYYAKVVSVSARGTETKITAQGKSRTVTLPVIGRHNILNALQAVSIANILGIETETAIEALKSMPQVPGRLERYIIDNSAICVIDFAHAPDGLEKLLTALHAVCKGRLIAAFGAGGDRDKTKRPVMGEIGTKFADYTILTTDNPRTEKPDDIIDGLEEGAKRQKNAYERITDRREAIYKGLSMLKDGDIFAIVGKGPETYMEIMGEKLPFLDKQVVFDWCKKEGREIR